MLDNNITKVSNSYSNQVTFNSVSGTLVKSCEGSRIVRFHMDSRRAETFFNVDGAYYNRKERVKGSRPYDSYECDVRIDIVVLQVMLCGGDNYLVEFIEEGQNED